MSMSDLSAMLTDLEGYGRSILETAREIRELFSAKDEPESNSKEQDERKAADTHQAHPAITLDDVRREMTGRIAKGYTAQCRELLKKYGAMKLSELLSACVERPQGKPTLVPEEDKRPAMEINKTTAGNDFKEEM